MIVADTSTWIAYLGGHSGGDVELLDSALESKSVVLAPVVHTELLSDPALLTEVQQLLLDLPLLECSTGYWRRAGLTRAKLIAGGHKACLADSLIAQSCIDHRVGLVTRDKDFRPFSRLCGLVLVS